MEAAGPRRISLQVSRRDDLAEQSVAVQRESQGVETGLVVGGCRRIRHRHGTGLARVQLRVPVQVRVHRDAGHAEFAGVPIAVAVGVVPDRAADDDAQRRFGFATTADDLPQTEAVVFDFAVGRRPLERQPLLRAETKPCVQEIDGQLDVRHRGRDQVGPSRDQAIGDEVFAVIEPIAVAVEIGPGVQETPLRGDHFEPHVLSRHELREHPHAVVIVRLLQVIAQRRDRRLPVGVGVNLSPQVHVGPNEVASAILGQQRRIRLVRRVAEIPPRCRTIAKVDAANHLAGVDLDRVSGVGNRHHDVVQAPFLEIQTAVGQPQGAEVEGRRVAAVWHGERQVIHRIAGAIARVGRRQVEAVVAQRIRLRCAGLRRVIAHAKRLRKRLRVELALAGSQRDASAGGNAGRAVVDLVDDDQRVEGIQAALAAGVVEPELAKRQDAGHRQSALARQVDPVDNQQDVECDDETIRIHVEGIHGILPRRLCIAHVAEGGVQQRLATRR